MTPIEQAIEKAGGLTELAHTCGVTPQAVLQWRQKGTAPAQRVLTIEKATGIPRHALRPDLYPEEPQQAIA